MDLEAKKQEIDMVLSAPDVDLWKLRELCLTEGGLVDDTLRKRAWPKLVGLHGSTSLTTTTQSSVQRTGRSRIPRPEPPCAPRDFQFEGISQVDDSAEQDDEHRKKKEKLIVECLDADQIDRDTARCTWHLLSGSQRSRRLQMQNKHRKKVSSILTRKQLRLSNFINLTLVQANEGLPEQEHLRYYQGFHDVASIFLSSLGGGGSGPIPANASPLQMRANSMGLDLPSKVLGQVTKSHFRDAMRSSFMQLQAAIRLVLFPLLERFDPEVHAHLYYCDMEPFFALSWIITWFSHDVRDTALVKRLFDAFIVSHPLFPLYLSAAMILHPINRTDILATDCDFAAVHHTLAGLPKNSSMVGWKFKVTDGYVSQDENVSTASTDMDSTFLSEDLFDMVGEDGSEVQSGVSSSSGVVGSNQARVPFQELIDTALSYMRRVPPRKLMGLSKRYFSEDPQREFLMGQAKSISLLQAPPSWSLAATSPADWVLKQQVRQSQGMKPTNRRDRRRSRSRSRTRSERSSVDLNDIEEIAKYLEEKQRTLAVIASGFGPGDDEEEKRRKRRKMFMWGAVAVALVAVSYGVMNQYGPGAIPISSSGEVTSDTMPRDLEESATREQMTNLSRSGAHIVKMSAPKSRPATVVSVSQKGRVDPFAHVESSRTKNGRSNDAASSSVASMSSTPKAPANAPNLTKYSTIALKSDVSIEVPRRRDLKCLLVHTRQALDRIDWIRRTQWVKRVHGGLVQAVRRLNPPNYDFPGAQLFDKARGAVFGGELAHFAKGLVNTTSDRFYKARQSLVGGEGVVKGTIVSARDAVSNGQGMQLLQDAVNKLFHFFAEGRGASFLKFATSEARDALAENEAEVVVL